MLAFGTPKLSIQIASLRTQQIKKAEEKQKEINLGFERITNGFAKGGIEGAAVSIISGICLTVFFIRN